MSYRTIILPFTTYGREAELLLHTALLWKTGVLHVLILVKEDGEQVLEKSLNKFKARYYKEEYKFISNKILCWIML